jgi:hypothetical protein
MSADTVDDVEAAEDLAGTLYTHLDRVLKLHDDQRAAAAGRGDTPPAGRILSVYADARAALTAYNGYCRPTCGWLDADDDDRPGIREQCEDSSCGCPCGHGQHEPPAREPHVHGPQCPRDVEGPTVMWLCGHEPLSTRVSAP